MNGNGALQAFTPQLVVLQIAGEFGSRCSFRHDYARSRGWTGVFFRRRFRLLPDFLAGWSFF